MKRQQKALGDNYDARGGRKVDFLHNLWPFEKTKNRNGLFNKEWQKLSENRHMESKAFHNIPEYDIYRLALLFLLL